MAGGRLGQSTAPAAGVVLAVGDRIYLVARFGMTTVLVTLFSLGMFRFEGHDVALGSELLFRIGLSLLVMGGLVHVASLYIFRTSGAKSLWLVLPFDLVAAGMLIWATGQYQDPFYPWVLGVSIAYAGIVRRRSSWIVAGLAASVYMLGHFVGHGHGASPDQALFLLFKAAGLVFTGWVVADAMERQVHREEEISAGR